MIRDARVDDCDVLSALAYASKASWGYDDAFMDACRNELSVTPSKLRGVRVRVADSDGALLGFHGVGVGVGVGVGELVWMFVAPDAMGRGVGAALCSDALAIAREEGLDELRIEADPNASGFYERMGARRV